MSAPRPRPLATLTRPQGANQALIDGSVRPRGYDLAFADEPVLVNGFRKMVRGLEYDVAEMAVTTYLNAKEHGVAFTALPIFLVRGFHHGAIQVVADGPIRRPEDLAGGRVGVGRGYTVTTGVWARSILATEYSLDLDSVTWVLSGDEHVTTYRPPANVTSAPAGRTLGEMLLAGELDAVVNAEVDDPRVASLIPEPEEAAFAALRQRGLYPINHLVVVRDDLLAERPDLAPALFEAFAEAKTRYVESIRAGEVVTAQDRMLESVLATTRSDPLPYGIEPNRRVLEELMAHATAQGILTKPTRLEDVFVRLD